MTTSKRTCWLVCFVAGSLLGPDVVHAQTAVTSTTITFNEYPFPTVNNTPVSNSSVALNLLNDSTGALLASDNGDQRDLNFSFSEGGSAPFGGASSTAWLAANSGQFTTTPGLPNLSPPIVVFPNCDHPLSSPYRDQSVRQFLLLEHGRNRVGIFASRLPQAKRNSF
jgi:hypothetical protein